MKKIISTLLLLSVVGSSNASIEGVKTHAKNHWPKYAITAGTLAAAGTAVFCDYKYNDSDYLNKVKALVAENKRNVAIGSAIVAGLTGLGLETLRGEDSLVRNGCTGTAKGVSTAAGFVKKQADKGFNKAKRVLTIETSQEQLVKRFNDKFKPQVTKLIDAQRLEIKEALKAVTIERDTLLNAVEQAKENNDATVTDLETANKRIEELNTAKTNLEELLEEAQNAALKIAQDAPVQDDAPVQAEEVENNEDNN